MWRRRREYSFLSFPKLKCFISITDADCLKVKMLHVNGQIWHEHLDLLIYYIFPTYEMFFFFLYKYWWKNTCKLQLLVTKTFIRTRDRKLFRYTIIKAFPMLQFLLWETRRDCWEERSKDPWDQLSENLNWHNILL